MKLLIKIVPFILGLALIGCGSFKFGSDDDDDNTHVGVDVSKEEKSSSYAYEFSLNGCETGKQTFDSKKAYCDGLLDEGRNKGCAKSIRHDAYKSGCEQYGPLDERT